MSGQPKIQDYAIIGDGRSAALISRNGSIDWLAWPRFDSPSIFAAILDRDRGGSWEIASSELAQIERQYIEYTNVLQTRAAMPSGTIVLTDFMPAASEEEKAGMLWPEQELIRIVECEAGELELEIRFTPRPDYGRAEVKIQNAGNLGYRLQIGRSLLALRCDVQLDSNGAHGLFGKVRLRGGETIAFSLSYSLEAPAVIPALDEVVRQKLALTIAWWQRWARSAKYRGPFHNEVIRSALVLKLLSYAPSGALVAAATTSLPERIGADLNWDYRFCWLRDAAFTVRALFGLGYIDDAEAFVSWLLHATRLTRPKLRTLYDVYGENSLPEMILSHFDGYRGSRPVRIGNKASEQLQLDVYGEVVEATARFYREREDIDRETQQMLRQCGEYVCRHWHEPDNGIWEPRKPRQHYTHSRLLCWLALDSLIDLQKRGWVDNLCTPKLEKVRGQIRREIEQRGWNAKLASYTQVLDGDTVDASTLLFAIYGFEEANSERMRTTHARLRERLSPKPGLMHRNQESQERKEGAFALCSFWELDYLARGGGTLQEARDAFKRTLSFANDLGLFAEQIDADSGDALGNFPQAFTHLGVINAALSLQKREEHDGASVKNQQDGTE
jgi:GH15 family glucan-1,4-alpha-glucosidase